MKHRSSGRLCRIWSRLSRSERRAWDLATRSPSEEVARAARNRSDRLNGWMHVITKQAEGTL